MSRFDLIMSAVDHWAASHEGWDCRADAEIAVDYWLENDPSMSDDEIVEEAITAWLDAE